MVSSEERQRPPQERSDRVAAPEGGRRRGGTQHVLDVVGTERLAPQLVRIHLGGDGFDAFVTGADAERIAKTDKYVKILFAKPELGLQPPFDLDALRETLSPDDMPVRRTYTVRSLDTAARTIAIDFVVHGDEGVAGPWAAAAVAGDRLCFSGPGGQYAPSTEDVEHLLIGDDSAIPAIAAAVDALPATARGLVLIEVESAANELALSTPAGVKLRWTHRRADDGSLADYGTALVAAVQALAPPVGAVDVFAHGEREAMKELRRILHTEWGLERRSMSLSAYWAKGRSEDRFQAEKREPVGQIFED
ncbi:siderophore-interacting protein [Microbacterium pumilum]|uniref:Siderophore-interacting protein n=1 Tax=Microbacterium pumilum TaxID=344165 RepID=A0ABP5D3S8_9MICO